jgi:serine/threonine-protein kinase
VVLGKTVEDDALAGTILEQDPAAGAQVSASVTEITVNISSGEELVTMIDLSNMEYQLAFLELEKIGLKYATPTYEYDDKIEKDHIISYTPLVDTQLPQGYQVQMVISKGPKTKTTVLTSLVGRTQEQAESDIRTMNLTVGKVDPVYDDEVEAGKVISQYPLAGTQVDEGTEVNLQVSLGPDPSKQVPQDVTKTITITLPDNEDAENSEVNLVVMMDGSVVWNKNYDTSMDLVAQVELTAPAGSTKSISYYFNGVLADAFDQTFD